MLFQLYLHLSMQLELLNLQIAQIARKFSLTMRELLLPLVLLKKENHQIAQIAPRFSHITRELLQLLDLLKERMVQIAQITKFNSVRIVFATVTIKILMLITLLELQELLQVLFKRKTIKMVQIAQIPLKCGAKMMYATVMNKIHLLPTLLELLDSPKLDLPQE